MTIEQRIIDNIKKYGWDVVNVLEGDYHPSFSYTVGLHKSFNSPEIFISGLNGSVPQTILNMIALTIKSGRPITAKSEMDDFMEGYNCYFDLVEKAHYDHYFGKALWFYEGNNFPVLQCVWPNQQHQYPWQTGMNFRQDILFNI